MALNGCSKKMCPLQVGTADNCNLTKEQCPYFTQDIDYHRVLKQIKVEVSKEIFEDIKAISKSKKFTEKSQEFEFGYRIAIQEILAELKKKYIGEDETEQND